MLNKVHHPIIFQGNLNKKKYFEGWYFKQVSADQKISVSFIPGISINDGDKHSFIQYIFIETDETDHKVINTGYVRYPIESFSYVDNPFRVSIGDSTFSKKNISIHLQDESFHFEGEIELGPLQKIGTSILQPNIMGIFGYIPKMECYHGVISMNHTLNNHLMINGNKVDFTHGKGYIEKDWGTSFPKEYIWLHSNHFKNTTTSLFFSVAHIPFHFTEFEGFICNFVTEDKEYRFATYNQSTCKILEVNVDFVHLYVENKHARLEIKAEVLEQGELIAPVKGTMEKTIKEGISGILSIRLEDNQTGETYEDIGLNAGVEIVDYIE